MNNDKIKIQIELASLLLHNLKLVDPSAILAGGAPRDWQRNQEASDLDFYLRAPNHNTNSSRVLLLNSLGITAVDNITASDPQYKGMPGLVAIYEGYKNKERINVIFREGSECHWEFFSNSLSMIYFNGYKTTLTELYELTMKTGIVFISKGYDCNHPHIKKMKSKFPQYKYAYFE